MRLAFLAAAAAVLAAAASLPQPPYVLPPARLLHHDGQDPMGVRLFRTTTTRTQISLSGEWDFLTDPRDQGRREDWASRFPTPETALAVPGSWNTQPRYWPYLGAAWYRRRFDLPREGTLRLRFAGVFYHAEVWLNGLRLGEHEGGYSPFEFTVPAAAGQQSLVVRVSNQVGDSTIPKADVDWFPYGGIHRPVYAELLPPVSISAFRVLADPGKLRVQARVRNLGAARSEQLRLLVDGRPVYAGNHPLAAGETALEFDAAFENARIWSPEEPNLYTARLVLGDNGDDQCTRFGVRTIAIDGPAILLNGKRLLVRGVNRHEDHPEWGPAAPAHLVRRDVELIKSLGANVVRSHYPTTELFADYCDQAGLLLMTEVPAWQTTARQLALPEVRRKIRAQFREMVERDLGRPCILSWSLGNEWPEPDRSLEIIRGLVDYARGVDRTHPLTLVTVRYAGPVHDLLDLIAANWGLHEWYDDAAALDASQTAQPIARMERIHARSPMKPVLLSEFGGAESRAGWHNWGNAKWSEEYQAANVEGSGAFGLENPWMSGGCVWQFSDSRTAPERILSARLHGWNSKGIVDAYRQPKMAFYALQRLYKRFAR